MPNEDGEFEVLEAGSIIPPFYLSFRIVCAVEGYETPQAESAGHSRLEMLREFSELLNWKLSEINASRGTNICVADAQIFLVPGYGQPERDGG